MKNLTKEECLSLLKENYIGHLAYLNRGIPETLPITYFFDEKNNSIISYSGEGVKIKMMREKPQVSFQVEEIQNISEWRSVLLYGRFEELEAIDAKTKLHEFAEGVKNILRNKENIDLDYLNEFSSKVVTPANPIVYRINISDIKGRQRL
ncbi:pyridoxamine 5'-phosphate oxidase family protein [Gramella sp. GC03-9]|uniref:Pyridoxamine 5'-phosphate oxidase family protein n=1 Tax=Christiangramia oceanisediminis TaxID=2920386 RepID=A0A9X2RDR7_9FLAO|nr:pyridoxamine 5'-phosphate oxidase family protein [Gramella oceanisediminis]MCP9200831.1 pyridoxamine 5'-phosphate oxidase family protein [Gramella oceanisediminis]